MSTDPKLAKLEAGYAKYSAILADHAMAYNLATAAAAASREYTTELRLRLLNLRRQNGPGIKGAQDALRAAEEASTADEKTVLQKKRKMAEASNNEVRAKVVLDTYLAELRKEAEQQRKAFNEAKEKAEEKKRTQARKEQAEKERLRKQKRELSGAEISSFLAAVNTTFNPQTEYSVLVTFPTPPAFYCGKLGCQRQRRHLKACNCNIKAAFAGLTPASLKRLRLYYHPDRFARCPEEVRVGFQKKAQEIFVALSELLEG